MASLNAKNVIAVGIEMAAEKIPFVGWTAEYRNRLCARYESIASRERLETLEAGQSDLAREFSRINLTIHREVQSAIRQAIETFRAESTSPQQIEGEIRELQSLTRSNWRPELFEGLLGESDLLDRLRREPEWFGGRCLGTGDEPREGMFHILLGAEAELRLIEMPPFALHALVAQAPGASGDDAAAFLHGRDDIWALPESLSGAEANGGATVVAEPSPVEPPRSRPTPKTYDPIIEIVTPQEVEVQPTRGTPGTDTYRLADEEPQEVEVQPTRGTRPVATNRRSTSNFEGQRAGDEWSANSLRMPFCWCPAGRFTMGSPEDEEGRFEDEDQVEVRLSHGFWIAKYLVTQDEYASLVGTNPSYFSASGGGKGSVAGESRGRFPVEEVSWDDAVAFCRRLTDRDRASGALPADWEYRLPTEAQWEYACRAGTTTAYCFGDKASRLLNFGDAEQLADYGWYEGHSGGWPHPVGAKRANAWGLHDVHGNVWEWCRDWFTSRLPGGVDPEVTAQASNRVFRGGSWYFVPRYCRAAFRNNGTPEFRYINLGFRPVAVQVQ